MKSFNKINMMTVLAMLVLVGVTSIGNPVKASASTRKCYSISASNTRVYSDTGLTNGKGWIYPNDEITV